MTDDEWRRIAPADCVGLPDISMRYTNEMLAAAAEQGITIPEGATVWASHTCRDGKWYIVPDTLKVYR